MGLFGFMGTDINQGVEEWKNTPGSVLLDVRGRDEYAQGHIPGSVNIPLNEIESVAAKVPDRDTRIFVHCLGGTRSSQAVAHMKRLGYVNVVNIGGINRYKGKVEV